MVMGKMETVTLETIHKDLEFLKKFKSDSTLTEKDALKLGRELNKNLVKRYKKA